MHQIAREEGTIERPEVFTMCQQVPKGKHSNFHNSAKSWDLKQSTYAGRAGGVQQRLCYGSGHLHTGAFGVFAGIVGAMMDLRQRE